MKNRNIETIPADASSNKETDEMQNEFSDSGITRRNWLLGLAATTGALLTGITLSSCEKEKAACDKSVTLEEGKPLEGEVSAPGTTDPIKIRVRIPESRVVEASVEPMGEKGAVCLEINANFPNQEPYAYGLSDETPKDLKGKGKKFNIFIQKTPGGMYTLELWINRGFHESDPTGDTAFNARYRITLLPIGQQE
ncbi:hypothetical protein HZA38_01600 [Candidatus Peregrinibacteria bacterium]|nr:hypothetical protein [Candidatus Peregrinibacteria bacterium]